MIFYALFGDFLTLKTRKKTRLALDDCQSLCAIYKESSLKCFVYAHGGNNFLFINGNTPNSDLSPSKSGESTTMATKGSKREYENAESSGKSSLSALNRLSRYSKNLSPVSSYYRPLMKTFGKRDESPIQKVVRNMKYRLFE